MKTCEIHIPPGGGVNGVKIEITGCAHLWGGEAKLAADLSRRLARQAVVHHIAIAGNLGAAWALARFAATAGQPALPAPDDEQTALAPLPVEALRLDPVAVAGLRRVGLKRIGDLYAMPRDALARRFGEGIARRLDQALGREPEPLSPLGEVPARRVRLSFAEPIADPADFARAIERLVADLAARLAREGTGARRLGLAFHRVDGRVEQISLGTSRPTRDPKHLAALFIGKLETVDPGLGVEDMILALFAAEPLPPEQTVLPPPRSHKNPLPPSGGEGRVRGAAPTIAFLPPHPNPLPPGGRGGDFIAADLAPLLDRLGARLGLDAVSRIEPHASHIPERAARYVPVGENFDVIPGRPARSNPEPINTDLWNMDSGFAVRRRPGMTKQADTGYTVKPLRPVRLFAPPEPVEAAVWVLPDDPPFRFTWRRRSYRVRRAAGPERIAEEWWTAEGSAAVDAWRDYYRVEEEEGRRFWLFRAAGGRKALNGWYIHGIFS